MTEQTLIDKYFSRHQTASKSVIVGVGDDAAVVNPPENSKLVVTTDTLNVGIHFLTDCDAKYVGHKSLAVSLSDIAAMGAIPLWATLSLSLSEVDHHWLKRFSDGLYNLAEQHSVRLIGGDLVKGPLSVTIQVIGYLKDEQSLLRNNCQVDDLLYVTGYLGDAGFGLKLKNDNDLNVNQKDQDYFLTHLQQPTPRLDVSRLITGIANAAIDISDGFLIDLNRLLSASNKGAVIDVEKIPISKQLRSYLKDSEVVSNVLSSGEDYQLIFTIKPKDQDKLEQIFVAQSIIVTEIGKIVTGSNICLLNKGKPMGLPKPLGFDHFT